MYNSYEKLTKENIWYYNFFFLNHILEVTTLNTYMRYKGVGKEGISLASFKELENFDDPDSNYSARRLKETKGWNRQTSTEVIKMNIYGSLHAQ